MDSRFKPVVEARSSSGKVKKKYFDKQFKKHLTKALTVNHGEPDNIEKIRGNRYLEKYPPEKIIDYVNSVSADVQKYFDSLLIEDPDVKETLLLANLMSNICDEKPQELPLTLKLKAESELTPASIDTHGVNFSALNHFLYSAVNGSPDYSELNKESLKVLYDTYQMLTEQVEHDATPEFLSELKSKVGIFDEPNSNVKNLAEIFKDPGLNPLSLPINCLLQGSLPEESETQNIEDPLLEQTTPTKVASNSSSSSKKSQTRKKSAKNDKN